MHAVDVVEITVPRLTHHRQPPSATGGAERVANGSHAECVRDCDRRAQHPGFPHPFEPGELAVPVDPVASGEEGVGANAAGVGEDDGDPGTHGLALDQGRVTHRDTWNVGDRVELPRRQVSDLDAELPSAHSGNLTVLRIGERSLQAWRRSGSSRWAWPCSPRRSYPSTSSRTGTLSL